MSSIRLKSISIKNYRSFGVAQHFEFPHDGYDRPVAIVGYNNSGKTNLINAILYGLQVNFVSKDTFTIDDFHNRGINKVPEFTLEVDSSTEPKFDGAKNANLSGYHKLHVITDGEIIVGSKIDSLNSLGLNAYGNPDVNYQAFGATRYYNIFFINFHNIKEEIVTNKTSWGNIRSFLGKHIQKIVDSDEEMSDRRNDFENEIEQSTSKVLSGSKLESFIVAIKKNYSTNLRNNDCAVEFGLPNYEDIFLRMLFKIGLNGEVDNLVPIDHFGDGYISMFVMAVIQAIAEFNDEDNCLFIFEEPESFLHENHQEYFYKTVLCNLAKNGHQVIYSTHSDKMLDPFDTKGLIRLELDSSNQTINKYNCIDDFSSTEVDETTGEVIDLSRYNEFIKTIEPNLSRLLFSKKVLLVEGPNDVMVYTHVIKDAVSKKISDNDSINDKVGYADTFMNFENISVVCHHGKGTALYLIELCKHFQIDYFVITDWDFKTDFTDKANWEFEAISKDAVWESISKEENSKGITHSEATLKKMMGTNRNLINAAGEGNIHFNVQKLETVIGYDSNDKSSLAIWELLNHEAFTYDESLFPEKLKIFLGVIDPPAIAELFMDEEGDDLPF
ncbi:putative ATP-dependent endonuclease of the OLD family [Owenweeksia hongkongensis DSM 17368]|uniref:Putative ATP-dependent endonuclease of the OLD family n=1 Tax=Owenweeksia hongkongensis (strain DSM 17368 / CIP 108786 / JCM 12287 / NRRL B-23963 / UST20020801) TaxID=926562 RepID=G8R7A5_OWEHD|nr:AAA family ATPase [Owenweeksia hongkongensis]AEV34512.1 putative ATP-dependent endonuclease of the OLD family [Owenweeksia hongkongensis DSM 17368]